MRYCIICNGVEKWDLYNQINYSMIYIRVLEFTYCRLYVFVIKTLQNLCFPIYSDAFLKKHGPIQNIDYLTKSQFSFINLYIIWKADLPMYNLIQKSISESFFIIKLWSIKARDHSKTVVVFFC